VEQSGEDEKHKAEGIQVRQVLFKQCAKLFITGVVAFLRVRGSQVRRTERVEVTGSPCLDCSERERTQSVLCSHSATTSYTIT
jgi:hypothetical protein